MAYQAPDYGGYERQRGDIDYKYSQDSTNNAYSRFISQQRGDRNRGDASREFGRSYAPQKASYGQRGLSGGGVTSGAMRESMNRYVGDYSREYQRSMQDSTMENQQYDMNQANLDQWRQQAYADLETQKANDIAWTAQNLQYLKSMLGGL